jgi:hypothetical protein
MPSATEAFPIRDNGAKLDPIVNVEPPTVLRIEVGVIATLLEEVSILILVLKRFAFVVGVA